MASVVSAQGHTRLVRSFDGVFVGLEQSLHHVFRRAVHGGVVQRPLLTLAVSSVCAASVGRTAVERQHVPKRACVCVWRRTLSFCPAASVLALSSRFTTASDAPFAAA